MDDNNVKPLGSRFFIVDPNEFDNQYAGGSFSDNRYNMSVPLEDLSISVELKSTSKARTVLTREGDVTVSINDNNGNNSSVVKVNFITGTKDSTTGNENYLTTNYTDVSSDLRDVEEALGIESIDIDFNSSYAPLINIKFIDVRGGAIFQNGGKSKYNLFFKLPYPLFELTIKGYYGKPVKYCLHMLKWTSKFNSKTGNFEISTQFVGYTYAMLSDMIIGYLKAAGETKRGKELLQARNVMSINDFLIKVRDIDKLVKNQLLSQDDEDATNLSLINELRKDLDNIRNEITSTVNFKFTTEKYEVPQKYSDTIVVIRNNTNALSLPEQPLVTPSFMTFGTQSNVQQSKISIFNDKINSLIGEYNQKTGSIENIKLVGPNLTPISVDTSNTELSVPNNELYQKISTIYGIEMSNISEIDIVINRLKDSIINVNSNSTVPLKIYDFTDLLELIENVSRQLVITQNDLTRFVSTKLKSLINNELGIDTSIRGITKLFTTHIEILLQQIYEVSAEYKNTSRVDELKRFAPSTDIPKEKYERNIIYPWPEYHENGIEKYLGSLSGPLSNPNVVPEIRFIEEMYQGMVKSDFISEELKNKILDENSNIWFAVNPLDTKLYGGNIKPYDRLSNASNQDDIARYILLRAIGFLGFSNNGLSNDEIETFARNEASEVLNKYKNETNKLINLLNINYSTPNNYSLITGTINDTRRLVLTSSGDKWEYRYIYDNNDRKILPLVSGFNNVNYNIPKNSRDLNEIETGGILLNNVINSNIEPNVNPFLNFFSKEIYENNSQQLNDNLNQSIFTFNVLNTLVNDNNLEEFLDRCGFIANSGKYGVQEFTRVQYDHLNIISPFKTIFISDGNQLAKSNDSSVNSNVSPSLVYTRRECSTSSVKYTTDWDITNTDIKLPITKKAIFDEASDFSYKQLNVIYTNRRGVGENKKLISESELNNTTSNISLPFLNFSVPNSDYPKRQVMLSLFGSRFYNAQSPSGKAFLFLHSLPWAGLTATNPKTQFFTNIVENILGQSNTILGDNVYLNGVFRQPFIINTFKHRTGFIQTPRLWIAFIGGLLWRYSATNDPIIFNINGSLLPNVNSFPDKNQYLTQFESNDIFTTSMSFDDEYTEIEDALLNLPSVVKIHFMNEFLQFINEYNTIRSSFEIVPVNGISDSEWVSTWNMLNDGVDVDGYNARLPLSIINSNLRMGDNKLLSESLNVFTFIPSSDKYGNLFRYNYILEFKDDLPTNPANIIKNLLLDYKYISNNTLRWGDVGMNQPILIDKTKFNIYFNSFNNVISNFTSENEKQKPNNNELNEIKLEIYRTIKKLYDKWVAYSDNGEDVVFQCCKSNKDRLPTDIELSKHITGGNGVDLKLIDSFRFLTRSFKDIGDVFQINPLLVYNQLIESTNISFSDFISRILTSNNFDFISLPSFVNFNDPDEVKNMFRPVPYYEASKLTTSGPSFVCVYVGQTSTKLDFGKNAEYPDDGINFTDESGKLPSDFTEPKQSWEDYGAAFIVRYGQQNQNMFKDITLDQTEFSETAESLQITDDISRLGSPTSRSYVGQNLYNVYSVRSYKTEVEMLGNAMIQPMMYFQLENIPMFRGAYLITKVRHSIRPNNMSTVFTGTRVKFVQTPIIDVATLYSGLLNSFDLPQPRAGSVLTTTVTSQPPIVSTIISNGGSNGNITNGTGNITLSKVPQINGVSNYKLGSLNNEDSMLTEATNALVLMLNEFVNYSTTNNLPRNGQTRIGITSLYRTIETQQRLFSEKKGIGVAAAGTSNHGWGIAVDLQFIGLDNQYISNNVNNISVGFDLQKNPSLKWFLDNSYRFGYIIPYQLRDGAGTDEFWHFEYHGKSAACLLREHPNVRNYIVNVNRQYESIQNPRTISGVEAVYNDYDCGYIATKKSDGDELTISTTVKSRYEENQIIVKNFFRDYFKNTLKIDDNLAKIITAGIMGNIQKETLPAFDEKTWTKDVDGNYAGGLISWNTGTYTNASIVIRNKPTIEQVTKIVDGYTHNFDRFIRECRVTPNLTPYQSAFLFAKIIEVCADCGNESDYKNKTRYNQSERSKYANDFYSRFNTNGDQLYW